jgi:RNA polymerase sigma factor (sigma-70 family)
MPRGSLNSLVRHIRKLVSTPAEAGLADAELLRRFVSDRDEAAFALLVERHGRLVRSVCRHLLANEEDVEDAFQATLLVLARKAAGIRKQRSVASWLYGVAYRTALKARTTLARRQRYERQAGVRSPQGPVPEAALRELQAILDEEVGRLPEKFRAPFVLCCLEGKSKGEASQELGWPEGTVSGRVAQARQLLQRRLTRRGVALSAALAALAVAEGAAPAAAPVVLAAGALQAALAFAAGRAPAVGAVSARAVALAEAVLRAEAAGRLKGLLALALVLTVAGAGAGTWWHRRGEDPRPAQENPVAPAPAPAPAAAKVGANSRDYAGRVLDADGRPRPGAAVALTALPLLPIDQRGRASAQPRVIAETRADADGRFTLSVTPEVAAAHMRFTVVTAGAGTAPCWYWRPDDAPRQDVELRLERRDHTVRGRLVDAGGRPAVGVTARVIQLAPKDPQRGFVQFPESGAGGDLPGPVTTDGEGGFEVHGLLPNCRVELRVQDDRFAPQFLTLTTGTGDQTDAGPLRLAPRRAAEGTVVCRETGRPLADVLVLVIGPLNSLVETRTDAQGHFRLHPFPGPGVSLSAYPPAGEPYLIGHHYVPWPDNEDRRVRLTLQRGVFLRGRVTEAGSGQPVAGAVVHFSPRAGDNAVLASRRGDESSIGWSNAYTVSDADGAFRLVGLPGAGHLLVRGPGPEYLHVETTSGMLSLGKPGGHPNYADAMIPLDLAPGSGPLDIPVRLRRGVTVVGRVVGEDGTPSARAAVVCPTYLLPDALEYTSALLVAVQGRFAIPGCDPDRAVPVLFYDPDRRQGARVEVKGGTEPTVRLAPCRSTVVRFVGADGKPAVGAKVGLDVVVHPRGLPPDVDPNHLHLGYAVDMAILAGPGCVAAGPGPGEVTFSGLIPGATYLIKADEGARQVIKKEFTVKADEDPRLPDIALRLPPAKPPRR